MIHKNLTLLENMSGKVSYEGKPVKAIGYYSLNTNKRMNTISIHTIDFTGRIYIYGTLKLEPTEEDWAIIPIGDGEDYLEFNHFPLVRDVKDNRYINIKGAWTYLKAKVDRDYLPIIKSPSAVHMPVKQITDIMNITADESVPVSKRRDSVLPPPSPNLKYFGNVEYIKLTY